MWRISLPMGKTPLALYILRATAKCQHQYTSTYTDTASNFQTWCVNHKRYAKIKGQVVVQLLNT
uniref:Uncharacterized protein n=1 Tax=Anguilla anguilla TaxID=7936 RepID=A0A0E9RX74_ANGAN